MSVTISMGTKKKVYKSIRLAAEAHNISYMVLYMRLRSADKQGGLGWKVRTAAKRPVRSYRRQAAVAVSELVQG